MLVGDVQQFTAVDELGRPRTDATWTVSDNSLATITTDSSPNLIAIAVGQVTLTASAGSVSAQVQVNILAGDSLPVGTTRWSIPVQRDSTPQSSFQPNPWMAHRIYMPWSGIRLGTLSLEHSPGMGSRCGLHISVRYRSQIPR